MPRKSDERLEIHIPRRERKRAVPRHMAPYIQTDVPPDKAFLTVDGKRVRNLAELADILDRMDDHAFRHHATAERNDFSNWIQDVMREDALAKSIRGKDRRGAQIEVLKHMVKRLMER